MTNPVQAQLAVDRAEFIDGLSLLSWQAKRARADQAIVCFEQGCIVIRIGGSAVSAHATGNWPGEARISAAFLGMVRRIPPEKDPVPIRVEGERLFIGATSIACVWQQRGGARASIPIGASLLDILRIGVGHSDEVLEASGIRARVETARALRQELIEKAAETLRPLGITAHDLSTLVDDRVANSVGPDA